MTIPEKEESEETPLLEEKSSNSSRRVSFHGDSKHGSREFVRAYSYLQQWTQSEREAALKKQGVGPAAFLICDAILGYTEDPAEGSFDPYNEEVNPLTSYITIKCRRWATRRPFMHFIQFIAWFMVGLSFVEPPVWCRYYTDAIYNVDGCVEVLDLRGPPVDDPKSDENFYYYPSTRMVLVTTQQAFVLEWVCTTILFVFVVLRLGRDGLSLRCYLRSGARQFVRFVQLVAILATLGSLIVAPFYESNRPFVYFLRIIVAITMSRKVQRELLTVSRLIPEIVDILALLFILILFYAWIGVMAFYGTDEGAQHFSDLIEGLWTLWTCVTTANYPDVMMPGYNENRWVAFFFVSFMIISFFFFMNVILGSVVNAYENQREERDKKRSEIAADDLNKAFKILDGDEDGLIDRETVMALFLVLNEDFPQLPNISDERASILFAFLDKDGSNYVSEEEFAEFSNVMLIEFEKTGADHAPIQRYFPKLYGTPGYQWFKNFVQSDKFEHIIDVVLVLNAVVVAIQSYPMLVGQSVDVNPSVMDGEVDTFWESVETLFTAIYCAEMITKLLVLGWVKFSKSYRNIFDLLITVVAVLATAYVYYPNEYSDSRLIRYVVMARVLRLSRVLVAIKKFQVIGATMVEILPACSRVFFLLFCIMYIFAALGMLLYGGMITRDPSNPLSYLLLGTDFSESEYWANNFNDMLSGMNVLFNLLVVNNWTVCWVGFEAVTATKWTRLFFLGFHLCCVTIVNNVVVAVVIGSFETQWDVFNDTSRMIEVVPGEAIIGERRAWFDATEVTGTKTELSGRYVARVRGTRLGGQRKLLRNLFTKSSSSVGHSSDRFSQVVSEVEGRSTSEGNGSMSASST